MAARAWVLNFDAEEEYATRGAYTPARRTLELARAMQPRLQGLLGADDVVIGEERLDPARFTAECWSPTPSALERVRAGGLELPIVPPFEVLQRVNHRRFAHELGAGLPGARFVHDVAAIEAALAAAPALGLLLKRAFGFAGRGQRRLPAGKLNDDDRRWCEGACANGQGALLEPWVERLADFALHGSIRASGELRLGRPLRQYCDGRGAWERSEVTGDLSADEREALEAAARETARALVEAGYFGPFGIDAFRYRARDGATAFNARVELNARYSMAWGLGMS